jgi:hypothetical protein
MGGGVKSEGDSPPAPNYQSGTMDHLHYRLNFDLNKSRQKFRHSLKVSITKLVIFQSFVAKCCKMRII